MSISIYLRVNSRRQNAVARLQCVFKRGAKVHKKHIKQLPLPAAKTKEIADAFCKKLSSNKNKVDME
jgi:hypothetical protein